LFSDFNGIELFYLACAIIGAVLVVFKLLLQFTGGGVDGGDVDFDVDGDFDPGMGHGDSDVGFHILSLLGLSSFFMMFGLVGLALYRQNKVGVSLSALGAAIGGLISIWIISRIFKGASKLQSSGTLQTKDAIGSTGTVYMNIPEGGTGRVSINFNNHLREFDATEKNGKSVDTGTAVRVVDVRARILVIEVTE
jgi:membrane protein implicated in regulation of membrane protease activity